MGKLIGFARDERGSELAEVAITTSVLVLLLIGIFQWLLAIYAYHFTTYAAQQGARFAMVRGYTWSKNVATNCSTSAPPNFTLPYDCTASSTDIQNYVQSLATSGITGGNVTIDTSSSYVWPGSTPDGVTGSCATHRNSQGCLVKVSVSYTVNFVPLLKVAALPITATSETSILQ